MTIIKQLEETEKHIDKVSLTRSSLDNTNNRKIAFAISLKSKVASLDWERVQMNLSNTLRSILSNTDQNFMIIVAGHEKPDIEEMNHEKVKWIKVNFPTPKNSSQYTNDKYNKRIVIGSFLRDNGFSGYFAPIDADDWVHYRFVEYIRSQPVTRAFILNKGFVMNKGLNEIWKRSENFFTGCGSCVAFYFDNKDLPKTTKKESTISSLFKVTIKSHTKIPQHLDEIKQEYKMIDIPLMIWVLGHGDNLSVIKGKKKNNISASYYHAEAEEIGDWLYQYFII